MFEVEIARGMAALDQIVPDWRAKVPADDRLDMMYAVVGRHHTGMEQCGCVLAHIFGDARDGAVALGLDRSEKAPRIYAHVTDDARAAGFDAPDQRGLRGYGALTDAWKLALTADPQWQAVHRG